MTTPDLPATLLADLRDVQPPMIAGILIGACLAKLSRVLRRGTIDAGLGPTQLFPLRLRRPLAMLTCAFEMCLGLALLVTVLPVGTRAGVALFAPRAATGARIAAAAFFLVAAAALAELRGRRPDLGCGCFGDFSTQPAGCRSIARAALLTGAALISDREPGSVPAAPRPRGTAVPRDRLRRAGPDRRAVAGGQRGAGPAGLHGPVRAAPAARRPHPGGAAPQPPVAQARPGDHHRAAHRHVARAVLAVRRLPVPPGREERGSGVRGPAEAAAPAGPGRRRCRWPRTGPRGVGPPRGRAGPGPSRGYAVIYARLARSARKIDNRPEDPGGDGPGGGIRRAGRAGTGRSAAR